MDWTIDDECAHAKTHCRGSDKPAYSETDEAIAKTLISLGFYQVSAKYRRVARLALPPVEELISFDKRCPAWIRNDFLEHFKLCSLRFAIRMGGKNEDVEHRTLSEGEFRAFKALGGQTA